MATLPALVTEMAKVDGRDRPTIEHIARVIREAGYITTGKRGGGADEKTVPEAVSLLIALNGADTPREAPLAIDRFRSLRQTATIGRGTPGSAQLDRYDSYPKAIQNVMDSHTFGEALEGLVEGVPELLAAMEAYADEQHPGFGLRGVIELGVCGVEVTFRRYFGLIEMFRMNGSERVVEFEGRFVQDVERFEQRFYGSQDGDRHVSVTIATKTLAAIWSAVNSNSEIGRATGRPGDARNHQGSAGEPADAQSRPSPKIAGPAGGGPS